MHFIKILNAQSEIELTIKLSQDLEYQVLQVAGCEMMLVLRALTLACLDLKYVEDHVPCSVE